MSILDDARRWTGRRRGLAACALAGLGLLAAGCNTNHPTAFAAADRPSNGLTILAASGDPTAAGSYLAGSFALGASDYSEAAEFLSRALKDDPDNRDLLLRAYRSLLATGRIADASQLASRVIALDRGDPLANLNLVVISIKSGDLAAAETRLAAIPRRGVSSIMAPLLLGWTHAGQANFDAALKVIEPLKTAAGLGVVHDLHHGLINDLAGNVAAAEASYVAAIERGGRTSLRVVEALGTLYERDGRREQARALYSRFAEENAESIALDVLIELSSAAAMPPKLVGSARDGAAEAFFNIASSLTRDATAETALIFGWFAIELAPELAAPRLVVGGILETLNRHADAIRVFDSVSKSSPHGWTARLRRANSLEAINKTEEAIADLKRMAAERAKRYDALVALGDFLRGKKRFDEAAKAYDDAIERIGTLERRHWPILYSRGIALERSKQWPRAEADFQRALELNPDQPHVLNYLGYSWVDQGLHLDRARGMLERAVSLRPNDGYIVDSLAWVLYRVGDYAGAVLHLERAVELRPQDPVINDHLGDAYWQVGRRVEARFQWQRALSLEPEPDQVDVIKEKIVRGLQAAKKPGGI